MQLLESVWICPAILLVAVAWLLLARLVRQRQPFPIPHFMVNLIDNPLRRLVQPLDKFPERLGLGAGMKVLEIGPGKGSYTLAAAKAVEPGGTVVALDIDDRIVNALKERIAITAQANIQVLQGDAQQLDFPEGSFDAVFAIAVIGEIPDRRRALREIQRVLVPGGTLALSELYLDPDSQPRNRLRGECEAVGLNYRASSGNYMHYTLLFQNPAP